jgi:hypothetical protein
LPDWIIPNGVIFNPRDPQVTLKNVSRLKMNPEIDSDFSFCWKNIFSQNLYRLDLNFGWLMGYQDAEDILAEFCQNVKTFLQETHLKHIVMEILFDYDDYTNDVLAILKLIPENCQSVTKFELLDSSGDHLTKQLDVICKMTSLKQLSFSQMIWHQRKDTMNPLKNLENLMELQMFEMWNFRDVDLIYIAQNCPKLVTFILHPGPAQDTRCITFDGIKTFVQECCSKDRISHVEINVDCLEIIDQDYELLAKLVKDYLPKIVKFIFNHKLLHSYKNVDSMSSSKKRKLEC